MEGVEAFVPRGYDPEKPPHPYEARRGKGGCLYYRHVVSKICRLEFPFWYVQNKM
jgi:hypothetical protein